MPGRKDSREAVPKKSKPNKAGLRKSSEDNPNHADNQHTPPTSPRKMSKSSLHRSDEHSFPTSKRRPSLKSPKSKKQADRLSQSQPELPNYEGVPVNTTPTFNRKNSVSSPKKRKNSTAERLTASSTSIPVVDLNALSLDEKTAKKHSPRIGRKQSLTQLKQSPKNVSKDSQAKVSLPSTPVTASNKDNTPVTPASPFQLTEDVSDAVNQFFASFLIVSRKIMENIDGMFLAVKYHAKDQSDQSKKLFAFAKNLAEAGLVLERLINDQNLLTRHRFKMVADAGFELTARIATLITQVRQFSTQTLDLMSQQKAEKSISEVMSALKMTVLATNSLKHKYDGGNMVDSLLECSSSLGIAMEDIRAAVRFDEAQSLVRAAKKFGAAVQMLVKLVVSLKLKDVSALQLLRGQSSALIEAATDAVNASPSLQEASKSKSNNRGYNHALAEQKLAEFESASTRWLTCAFDLIESIRISYPKILNSAIAQRVRESLSGKHAADDKEIQARTALALEMTSLLMKVNPELKEKWEALAFSRHDQTRDELVAHLCRDGWRPEHLIVPVASNISKSPSSSEKPSLMTNQSIKSVKRGHQRTASTGGLVRRESSKALRRISNVNENQASRNSLKTVVEAKETADWQFGDANEEEKQFTRKQQIIDDSEMLKRGLALEVDTGNISQQLEYITSFYGTLGSEFLSLIHRVLGYRPLSEVSTTEKGPRSPVSFQYASELSKLTQDVNDKSKSLMLAIRRTILVCQAWFLYPRKKQEQQFKQKKTTVVSWMVPVEIESEGQTKKEKRVIKMAMDSNASVSQEVVRVLQCVRTEHPDLQIDFTREYGFFVPSFDTDPTQGKRVSSSSQSPVVKKESSSFFRKRSKRSSSKAIKPINSTGSNSVHAKFEGLWMRPDLPLTQYKALSCGKIKVQLKPVDKKRDRQRSFVLSMLVELMNFLHNCQQEGEVDYNVSLRLTNYMRQCVFDQFLEIDKLSFAEIAPNQKESMLRHVNACCTSIKSMFVGQYQSLLYQTATDVRISLTQTTVALHALATEDPDSLVYSTLIQALSCLHKLTSSVQKLRNEYATLVNICAVQLPLANLPTNLPNDSIIKERLGQLPHVTLTQPEQFEPSLSPYLFGNVPSLDFLRDSSIYETFAVSSEIDSKQVTMMGEQLKGATLDQLIVMVTSHEERNSRNGGTSTSLTFMDQFMLAYTSFTTPYTLLSKLLQRYIVAAESSEDQQSSTGRQRRATFQDAQLQMVEAEKQNMLRKQELQSSAANPLARYAKKTVTAGLVQHYTLNLLSYWLKNFPRDFDNVCLLTLFAFSTTVLTKYESESVVESFLKKLRATAMSRQDQLRFHLAEFLDFSRTINKKPRSSSEYTKVMNLPRSESMSSMTDEEDNALRRPRPGNNPRTLSRSLSTHHLPSNDPFSYCLTEIIFFSSVEELARQLTLIDETAMQEIDPREMILKQHPKLGAISCPHIQQTIERSNSLCLFVASTVLTVDSLLDRIGMIEKFIEVAYQLYNIHNFNTLIGILAGLGCAAVDRLKFCWAGIKPELIEKFKHLQEVFNPAMSFKNYRTEIKKLRDKITSFNNRDPVPVLPYLGTYLADLIFTNEGNAQFLTQEYIEDVENENFINSPEGRVANRVRPRANTKEFLRRFFNMSDGDNPILTEPVEVTSPLFSDDMSTFDKKKRRSTLGAASDGAFTDQINWMKVEVIAEVLNEFRLFQATPFNFPRIEPMYTFLLKLPHLQEEDLYQLSQLREPRGATIAEIV